MPVDFLTTEQTESYGRFAGEPDEPQFRLTRLLYTRSWISNERPGLLFDLSTGWLLQHRVILPGATTLND